MFRVNIIFNVVKYVHNYKRDYGNISHQKIK